ncbi:MAG: hypothetical protein K8T26_00710 [Lentisphaerae bacterium]|nr:hypothetical protein [Lentisphaerota bacterium]
MTPRDTARRHAMNFLAAYDSLTGDDERRIARMARTWLSLLRTRQSVQRMVDDMIEEFYDPATSAGGCGWEDLRLKFTQWAIAEDWLPADATPRRTTGSGSPPDLQKKQEKRLKLIDKRRRSRSI